MLKIVDIVDRKVNVEIEVTSSVNTYNVTTSDMTDDCIPCRIAQKAMMWLSKDGLFAEIECIYPQTVENPTCVVSEATNTVMGSPILELVEDPSQVWVESRETYFTIWLAQGKVVEQEIIVANNLKLLAAQGHVVGITAVTNE